MRKVIRTSFREESGEYPRLIRRGAGITRPRKKGESYAVYLCRLLDLYLAKAVKEDLFDELFDEYLEKVRLEGLPGHAEKLEEYAEKLEGNGRGDLACRLRLLLESRGEVAEAGQE